MRIVADALTEVVIAAYHGGLAELDPARLVERALPPLPPKRARVRVIAAGKAAARMTEGAIARWGARIEDALVITPGERAGVALSSGSLSRGGGPVVAIRCAAHPVPDERSVEAAEEALRRAGELGRDDLLLALISGGASSLLAAPPSGMRLAEKQALVAALLESGAPITEVNLVRRHLSRIKGGRLAIAATPARVLTLLVSDVVGGAPCDIGSGPTVVDPTTVSHAVDVLRRRAPDRATPELLGMLSESLKAGAAPQDASNTAPHDAAGEEPPNAAAAEPPRAIAPRLRMHVLADPDRLAQIVANELSERGGLRARALPAEQGDALEIVRRRLALADRLTPGEAAVIPCEPTLALPPRRGRGGRAGWIALATMRALPADVLLLCAATDGMDGSSGSAGAAVTRSSAASLGDSVLEEALASFNDAQIHERLGTRLEGGPTGHNLTDLHVLVRAP